VSHRTVAVEHAYDYVPNESGALGLQRYGADEWHGQYGIVALFPNGPQPWGGAQGAGVSAGLSPVLIDHADGALSAWYVTQPLSILLGNWGYYDTSPWGAALRFVQTTAATAGAGFSYSSSRLQHSFYGPPGGDEHGYTVFAVVKNFATNDWHRHFFTLAGGQSISFAYNPIAEEIAIIRTGTLPGTTTHAIGSYLRDDGWMLLAFQFHSKHDPLNSYLVDTWVNGHRIATDDVVASGDITQIEAVLGADATNKDGLAWDGIIAQVAVLIGDDVRASEDLILGWHCWDYFAAGRRGWHREPRRRCGRRFKPRGRRGRRPGGARRGG